MYYHRNRIISEEDIKCEEADSSELGRRLKSSYCLIHNVQEMRCKRYVKKNNTTYLKSILYLRCLIIYIFDKPVKKTKIDEVNNNMSVVLELRRKT